MAAAATTSPTAAAAASTTAPAAAASTAAASADAAAGADPFAALDKDALQPLSPDSAKRHTAADIQIYASPEKKVAAATAAGEWKCQHCSWKNAAGTAACYLCKAGADGTKKTDPKAKPSAFAAPIDMNAATLASPTASSALDELMGTAAPGSNKAKK